MYLYKGEWLGQPCRAWTSSRLVPLLEVGEITYDFALGPLQAQCCPVHYLRWHRQTTVCFLGLRPRERRPRRHKILQLDVPIFRFRRRSPMEIIIDTFRGTRRISTLIAFPFHFHPDKRAMRARLIRQGRKFVSLMGPHHCHCRARSGPSTAPVSILFVSQDHAPVQPMFASHQLRHI